MNHDRHHRDPVHGVPAPHGLSLVTRFVKYSAGRWAGSTVAVLQPSGISGASCFDGNIMFVREVPGHPVVGEEFTQFEVPSQF